MTAGSTRSKSPSSMTARAPVSSSSAGWNSAATPNGGAARARRATAPSRTAIWPSCPHAWLLPGAVDAYSAFVASSTGRASRHPRRSTSGRASDTLTKRPVPAMGRATTPGASRDTASSTKRPVSRSSKPSSGIRCAARRIRTSSGSRSRAPATKRDVMTRSAPLPTLVLTRSTAAISPVGLASGKIVYRSPRERSNLALRPGPAGHLPPKRAHSSAAGHPGRPRARSEGFTRPP